MNSPLAEALELTRGMLAEALAGNRSQFQHLHERRTRLFKPGLYAQADAARLLPQLDAAQKELEAMLDDDYALDDMSELLRPISGDPAEIPPASCGQHQAIDATP